MRKKKKKKSVQVSVGMSRRKGKRARTCEDDKVGKGNESNVIVMDILSSLPLKSLLTCKYVCKTWLQIISNSHFAKLHLSRSSISILVHNAYVIRKSRYLLSYQIDNDAPVDQIQSEAMKFTPRFILRDSGFKLVNSCNGLICLYEFEKESETFICNPVLGEFITIKVPHEVEFYRSSFCVGFSAKTDEYKVLKTFDTERFGSKAKIYTIVTGSWRSLGNALSMIENNRSTLSNGAFHWINYRISCFDFEEELFRAVPSPPKFRSKEFQMLGVIGDCLSACCYRYDGPYRFDIWVMKEYGIKESWTRQFPIENAFYLTERHPVAEAETKIKFFY